ncbi:GAF domain-containing protein [Arthrobacter sp. JSM 101049]|uniref:GAF domain-containing protein n=1 Tax=Arthrobacter sp. JSM 101049 TaxID=929097 RepID=UPI00356B50FB
MALTSPASPVLQQQAERAHARLASGGPALSGWDDPGFPKLRPVVHDSWVRSLGFHRDPARARALSGLSDPQLDEFRRTHPLASVMPVFDRLLVQPARDTGILVAVGDDAGRLLWVEGDPTARRAAELMSFVPGADWSERAVGTSAPGTALATGSGVQVSGAEHFSPEAHRWSCSAVPIHCPLTGRLLGVVDLTGNDDAVAGHSLALLQAAVAAAESQLRLDALDLAARGASSGTPGRATSVMPAAPVAGPARLRVLGYDDPVLERGPARRVLGGRHIEILTLLAWHHGGLDAAELAGLLFGDTNQQVSARAEMVRLRKALGQEASAIGLDSRPYRVAPTVGTDARDVLRHLAAGRHRQALDTYGGPVLPRSDAPGIADIRVEVSGALREAMLNDADPGMLLEYLDLPEAADDVDGLRTALQILPPRSPGRSVVVSRLQRLEAELA